MENRENEKLLYDIDKRLAVLETLQKEHSESIFLQLAKTEKKLDRIEKQLEGLKIRVAGIATAIVMVGQLASRYFL